MSLSSHINEKANLIWAIADKLTGVYKPHEYGEVILLLYTSIISQELSLKTDSICVTI